MTKSRAIGALLALALTVSIVPATMAQDDDPVAEDPNAVVDITGADISQLDLLFADLEANIAANTEVLEALVDEVLPEAAERVTKIETRSNLVPELRARIKANNQVTKEAVKQIAALQQQVSRLSERASQQSKVIQDLRANVRGINAALERLGESGCTGPNCAD